MNITPFKNIKDFAVILHCVPPLIQIKILNILSFKKFKNPNMLYFQKFKIQRYYYFQKILKSKYVLLPKILKIQICYTFKFFKIQICYASKNFENPNMYHYFKKIMIKYVFICSELEIVSGSL